MPKKDKKPKPKKIRAVRAPRAPRVANSRRPPLRASKPHTHIINVYTTPSTEQPFNPSFSSQTMPFTTSTQYVSPKPIPVKVEPKELTTQNVYNPSVSPFQVPFGVPLGKPKINIGLDRRDMPLDVINLETSEAETSAIEKKTRGPYKSKGKGSTIEKHKNIGKNIQNEFVKMVEGYNTDAALKDVNTVTTPMQFYTQGGNI